MKTQVNREPQCVNDIISQYMSIYLLSLKTLFYDDPNIDLINDFFEDLPFVSFDSLIIMTCKSNINGLLFDNMWLRMYNT